MTAKPPVVLDASLALSLFFPDEEYGERVRTIFMNHRVLVPDIWINEMGNALLMAVRRKRKTREDARADIVCLKKLPVEIYPASSNMEAIFDVAVTHNLGFYDASYLALAVKQQCDLASVDEALCRAAEIISIVLFPIYPRR